jgi:hypothetical protein
MEEFLGVIYRYNDSVKMNIRIVRKMVMTKKGHQFFVNPRLHSSRASTRNLEQGPTFQNRAL